MTVARPRFDALLRTAIVAAVAGASPAVALADATPAQVIAAVNAERSANGIPAGVVENPAWSRGCALHNAYRRLNGIGITGHDEDPALRGYTPEGDEAGNTSVLSTQSWSTGNPFATAPIHLMHLLAPRIEAMGADDADGLACVSTLRGQGAGSPVDVLYTAPGDGRSDVPPAETARESPFVPGALLSPVAPPTTGPHILVLADGPFTEAGPMRITRAHLQGPGGPVEVRTIDETDTRIADYIPPGGMLIPSAPLAEGTVYTASVVVEGAGGGRLARTWSFRTAGPVVSSDPTRGTGNAGIATERATLSVAVRGRQVLVSGPAVLRGRSVRIALTRRGAMRHRTMVLSPSAALPLRHAEARDATRITVSSAGFVRRGVRWHVPPVRTTVARARR